MNELTLWHGIGIIILMTPFAAVFLALATGIGINRSRRET